MSWYKSAPPPNNQLWTSTRPNAGTCNAEVWTPAVWIHPGSATLQGLLAAGLLLGHNDLAVPYISNVDICIPTLALLGTVTDGAYVQGALRCD